MSEKQLDMTDPDRCQGYTKDGRPCMRHALKPSRYCFVHGGLLGKRQGNIPIFYRKRMTKTLKQAVMEAMNSSPAEQLSLYEELALTRVMAGKAVTMYAAACESKDEATIAAATTVLATSLAEVQRMCESAARVEALARDRVSIHAVSFVVGQIIRIVHNVLKDPDLEFHAREIEDQLRNNLLIDVTPTGTSITPDQDVRDMLETVPFDAGTPDEMS